MADGHLNICKECVKARMSKHRETHLEEIRAYDRERAKLPHRKKRSREITRKRRHETGYELAHNAIEKAINSGELIRSNVCQVCGKYCKPEGHHYNYDKRKSVIWLCAECHRQYHTGKTERAKLVQQIVNAIAELKNREVS
jgi:ribosome-binding protein aMBF1 (putative translation factor)